MESDEVNMKSFLLNPNCFLLFSNLIDGAGTTTFETHTYDTHSYDTHEFESHTALKISSSLTNNNELFTGNGASCALSSSTTVSITSLTSAGTTISTDSIMTAAAATTTTTATMARQFTSLTPVSSITAVTSQSWDSFDEIMPELTELLPATKVVLDNEMDSLTALMVGGS